jgi:2-polyprenyl-3-methyl-5-hydroxy-6-metoxy-1,4-benzoquinol methylase
MEDYIWRNRNAALMQMISTDSHILFRKVKLTMPSSSNIAKRALRRLASILSSAADKINPNELNLMGDRDIEHSWILSRIGNGPGKALEVGCGDSMLLSLTAAQRGYDMLAMDRERHEYPSIAKGVTFKLVDLLEESFSQNYFDLIMVCSTIEHIGLPNRYQVVSPSPEGDLIVMEKLHGAIEPDGRLLLTLPIGLDAVFAPYHRVYGEVRLPRLLKGWSIAEEIYWVKQPTNQWLSVSRQEALLRPGSSHHYGLGCFVLRK